MQKSLWERILNVISFGTLCADPKPVERKSKIGGRAPESSAPKKAGSKPDRQRKPKPDREKPNRAPVLHEVTSNRLYVGNLSYDATEEDLSVLFNGVGSVQSAEVVSNRRTQRSKGYAFVEMQNIDEAKRAVDVLHDKDFMERKLAVSGAKSSGPADGEQAEQDDPAEETPE